ncbi:nicotinamidase-related amidase [Pseudomonas sp. SLBN-26]|uniref:cysteine hydrolase family protein n=1 Tax=Pseudomonadaceae TaxID=135621 RepID=UPI00114EA90F|nr:MULTISPECIES: cysteine hydrolase family protein [Pseudomonas]MCP1618501.1 nicotinamidase-related amidase [Pseudomonas otitidis]TQL07733.1 nicotinamidase-related amidase [Pseudomonas sp. SLBN-26]
MHTPAALLIIDQQRGIRRVATPRNHPEAEARMAELLALWRQRGWPLVHIRHISRDPASVFAPGQDGARFQDAFEPRADEAVLEKNVTDAFSHSQLERWLHVRGLRAVVVVGVASENSVEATARSASCLGFAATVVSDACYTFAKPDWSGRPRTAEEVHDMAMANLAGEYGRVLDCATLLAELGA